MQIPDIEHVSFIEGLLFYIALHIGDDDDLMRFLKVWAKEYAKREFEELSGRHEDDDRQTI